MSQCSRPSVSQWAAVALVVFMSSLPLLAGQQPGRSQVLEIGSGVVSLDVYAQDTTLDLLITTREGGALELSHQRSTDGGETWGTAHVITVDQPISIARRGNEPQVVAHREHIAVHWSTHGESRHGAGPMATAVSHDAGGTWTAGPNPTGDAANVAQNFADMAADPDGTFYVAWIGSHDGPAGRGLGVARSTDFGESREYSQLVDPTSCACCWNRMMASKPGEVRVLYREYGIRDMALASTTDGGENWDLSGPVGGFNWEFPGCPHVGGGLATTHERGREQLHALVWTGHEERHGLYWVRSTDDGVTWSEPVRMGGEMARHADLGGSGRTLVAAWDEDRGILVTVSTDQGNTWHEPRRVSSTGFVASHPIVVHTGDGFRVFWTERGAQERLDWKSHRLGATPRASESG
jgi:hypothetical protein